MQEREERVLVITSEPEACEFISIIKMLNMAYEVESDLESIELLDQADRKYSGAVICSLTYPYPNVLTEKQIETLEKFVQKDGRLYLEFSKPSGSKSLFGVTFGETPKRALHERIFVLKDHYVSKEIGVNTILEEHNSAFLPLPKNEQNINEILRYERLIGTYKAIFPPPPTYQVILDLESSYPIQKIILHHGGGIKTCCPEKVRIYASPNGKSFSLKETLEGDGGLVQEVAEIPFHNTEARFIKFGYEKFLRTKKDTVGDWLTDTLLVGGK